VDSNQSFGDLLQYLTGSGPVQARRRKRARAGWPDGRRKFGTVSQAILSVLARAESDMKVSAIREEVERLLDGEVSRFNVSDYLRTRSRGPRPLFIHTRPGHYRLVRER